MSIWRTIGATAAGSFILVAGAAFLFVKTRGLSAEHKPSNLEYAIANFALAQSIPQSLKAMKNPATGSAEVLTEARREFHAYCAVCHGDDGLGKTPTAAGMSPEVPDLHADHVQKWTDGELFFIIKNGVRFTGMPGWNFDDGRIWRLVLNVRTFRSNAQNEAEK